MMPDHNEALILVTALLSLFLDAESVFVCYFREVMFVSL